MKYIDCLFLQGEKQDEQNDDADAEDELITLNSETGKRIAKNQAIAIDGIEKQAKRMKVASDARFQTLEKGSSVLVPVADVDRNKGDFRNLLGKFSLTFIKIKCVDKY